MLQAPSDIEILESVVAVMSPAEAISRVGEVVTVQGQIVNVFIPERGPARLNFDRDYKRSLNLVIFNREQFGSLRANYLNKTIQVTGTVGTYRDQVQIRVEDPSQIKVIE